MDRIDKFTRKLERNIALRILEELKNIKAGNTDHLQVRKLRGKTSSYRARIGNVRIQFIKTGHGNVIVDIGFRDDTTY